MAIPFLNHLDLRSVSELQNAILHKTTSSSASNVEGKIIYDTGSDSLKYYNGSAWINLDGSGDISAVNTASGSGLSGGSSSGAVDLQLVVDDTTLEISTNTVQAKTAAIADSGTALATADQIHTFVTSYADAAGTDNSTNVTLETTSHNYLHISGQEITLGAIELGSSGQDITGTLPIDHGGTGQTTAAAAANALLNVSQGGALSIGDGSDTITIAGNLTVTGDTTYKNETIQIVTDNTIAFEGATADAHEILLTAADATGSDKTITLPNATGTVALTSDINNATLTVQGTGALGGSGTFTANQSSNATISISHDDTSTQASVDNSALTVIQDVTLDTYGHVTGLASVDLESGIDGRITAKHYVGLIGDGTATSIGLGNSDHSLGTSSSNFLAQLVEVSTGATVNADVVRGSGGSITFTFAEAPASNAIRVLITKIG